jgi:hypothetical protein
VNKPLPIAVRASMQKEAALPIALALKAAWALMNAKFVWDLGKSGLSHGKATLNAKNEDGTRDWRRTAKHAAWGTGLTLSALLSARFSAQGLAALPSFHKTKKLGQAMNRFTKTLTPGQQAQIAAKSVAAAGPKYARTWLNPSADTLKARHKILKNIRGYNKQVQPLKNSWNASVGPKGLAARTNKITDRFAPERLFYRNSTASAAEVAKKRQRVGSFINYGDAAAGMLVAPLGFTGADADSDYAGLGTPEYAQIQQQRQQALAEAHAAAQGQEQPPQQMPQAERRTTNQHRQHPSQRAGGQQQPRLTPQQQHLQQLESDWQQRQRQYRQNTRFE